MELIRFRSAAFSPILNLFLRIQIRLVVTANRFVGRDFSTHKLYTSMKDVHPLEALLNEPKCNSQTGASAGHNHRAWRVVSRAKPQI